MVVSWFNYNIPIIKYNIYKIYNYINWRNLADQLNHSKQYLTHLQMNWGSPYGIVVNVLDCDTVVRSNT